MRGQGGEGLHIGRPRDSQLCASQLDALRIALKSAHRRPADKEMAVRSANEKKRRDNRRPAGAKPQIPPISA